MIPRRTLAGPVVVEAAHGGRGLFTGEPARLELRPSDAGLAFVVGGRRIPATIDRLCSAAVVPAFEGMPPRHTVLEADGARAITTEHVLAALFGCGITDADIVLEGGDDRAAEVPIDDGSALVFARAIDAAGVVEIGASAEPLVVRSPVSVEDGSGGVIHAEPAAVADLSYRVDYGAGEGLAGPIAAQSARWSGSGDRFREQIAPARTYSLRAEAEAMHRAGLFAAFTPADLPVVDDDGTLIDNAWRFDDEPARHKLLDLIGDLALVGRPIIGQVMAARSGHALNHRMARTLLDRFG